MGTGSKTFAIPASARVLFTKRARSNLRSVITAVELRTQIDLSLITHLCEAANGCCRVALSSGGAGHERHPKGRSVDRLRLGPDRARMVPIRHDRGLAGTVSTPGGAAIPNAILLSRQFSDTAGTNDDHRRQRELHLLAPSLAHPLLLLPKVRPLDRCRRTIGVIDREDVEARTGRIHCPRIQVGGHRADDRMQPSLRRLGLG